MDTQHVEVRQAIPAINEMIKRGGECFVRKGSQLWWLSHGPLDRPLEKFPWPLSLLEPSNVHLSIYEDNKVIHRQTYSRYRTNEAISLFLRGLEPTETITIFLVDYDF